MSISLLALAIAGQAAAPAAAAAPKGAQALFDAGTAAASDGRCAEAVSYFDQLDASGATKRNALLGATVGVRKGRCLLDGPRAAEGKAAIARGLPVLREKGEGFAGDVYDAQMALGRQAQRDFDYDAAARAYADAAAQVKDAARIPALLRLAQATLFDHDGRALAATDEALRLAAASDLGKKNLAAVQTIRARVLLNEGRAKDAYALLKDSLAKQGGLTNRVGASDIATRSDLAIAALKTGDRDNARRYLAYTGAGRVENTPFTSYGAIEPPTCGEGGLTPEDEAIVEFSMEEDGHVAGVAPIYTNGGREKAIAFARAVTDWSWRAADAAKIAPLFRMATRVEIRCVVADRAPQLIKPLADAAEAWLAEKGAGTPAWADRAPAIALPMQRAALTAATAAGDRLHQLQAALAAGTNPVIADADKAATYAAARAAADALAAPASVRGYIDIESDDSHRGKPEAERKRLRALLVRPDLARDPLTAATLRLLIAQPVFTTRPPADADALLHAVADEPSLPAQHPLKIAALLQQANLLAAKGDLAGASGVFARTGLTGEQCSMLGLQPAMKRTGFGASNYPDEAIRMGFEGWVRIAYDIAADGHTVAPRSVIAYPPFIFDEAATGMIRDTRYTSTFRPEGALACSGEQQAIRFVLPGGAPPAS
ncbi:energy transducer TonB [Sphingomonas phyllosphaerae]|uniref:energy transducer TonB n=1 Tax=Sphingomonas phyllosphaerae TaxID=257003 RepID=UPI00041E3C10|nr:energy transducer TonB [Sphingomonas phyllosphaerae]